MDCHGGLPLKSNRIPNIHIPMKSQNKLFSFSAVAALLASPVSFADAPKGGAEVVTEVEVVPDGDAGAEVVISEEPSENVEDGGEVVSEPGDEGEGTEPTDEVILDCGVPIDWGTGVPIDWVKRGEGNPDVMFYSMADGEVPMFKGTVETGQDDKAAAIESKGAAAAPQITREKKGPLALIKKGRVFLR